MTPTTSLGEDRFITKLTNSSSLRESFRESRRIFQMKYDQSGPRPLSHSEYSRISFQLSIRIPSDWLRFNRDRSGNAIHLTDLNDSKRMFLSSNQNAIVKILIWFVSMSQWLGFHTDSKHQNWFNGETDPGPSDLTATSRSLQSRLSILLIHLNYLVVATTIGMKWMTSVISQNENAANFIDTGWYWTISVTSRGLKCNDGSGEQRWKGNVRRKRVETF